MKAIHLRGTLLCIVSILCIAFAPSMRAVGIVNGGFETGTFSGWTVIDPSGFTNIGPDPAFAHSGMYHANLGATPNMGSLSQNVATMTGPAYTLSFWLANDIDPGLPPFTSFQVYWGGALIFNLTTPPAFDYTQFTFANLFATGPSTSLEFRYEHDNDFFRLDDVSLNVPDSASTLWLAFPTLGLLTFAHYRSARRSRMIFA